MGKGLEDPFWGEEHMIFKGTEGESVVANRI